MSPRATFGHAPAGELERVVGGLVVEDLDHDHHAFLAGNLGRDADLVRETEAWVTEAILSTTTVRMALIMAGSRPAR